MYSLCPTLDSAIPTEWASARGGFRARHPASPWRSGHALCLAKDLTLLWASRLEGSVLPGRILSTDLRACPRPQGAQTHPANVSTETEHC